jgi:predicted N-acyltransferase
VDVIITDSLDDVPAQQWDALLRAPNPFAEHAFLKLLEDSGSVGAGAGWAPYYVLVRDGDQLLGATFAYLKDHSYGEYIFDWSWADAAMRAGVPYYPKLVVAVPFTPATGPRLLVHPDADQEEIWTVLAFGLEKLMEETKAYSIHILYCTDEEAAFLDQSSDWGRRGTYQFHWRNDGYEDFDAFLSGMRSQVRKQIKKERRRVHEAGLDIRVERGDELSTDDWATVRRLYRHTSSRKWGSPYLEPRWFDLAGQRVGDSALVATARRGHDIVAMTLSFERGPAIYGRYWGSFERVDGLHFELCYYQLIERAIAKGQLLVEAGAQGQHKVKRGYLPCLTHSMHRFLHPGLNHAIGDLVKREREAMEPELEQWQKEGPFKAECVPPYPAVAGIDLGALASRNEADS